MRRAALFSTFLALIFFAAYREGASQTGEVKYLSTDVYWRAAGPDKKIIANAGWVEFRDYVLVIDANYPVGARAIIKDIRSTTNKPIKFVFDTHYHADHAHGNGVFVDAGATIVCSAECIEESLRKNPEAWAKSAAEYNNEKLEHPQIGFKDKMVFDDGVRRVELIKAGPGHTLGDAVAWLPKERILFTGDLCVNLRPGNNVADPDADIDNWVRALDELYKLDARQVVPGHGGLGTKEALKGQRNYLAAKCNLARPSPIGRRKFSSPMNYSSRCKTFLRSQERNGERTSIGWTMTTRTPRTGHGSPSGRVFTNIRSLER